MDINTDWFEFIETDLLMNASAIEIQSLQSRKCMWKYRLRGGGYFVSAPLCFNGPRFEALCERGPASYVTAMSMSNSIQYRSSHSAPLPPAKVTSGHMIDKNSTSYIRGEAGAVTISQSLHFLPVGDSGKTQLGIRLIRKTTIPDIRNPVTNIRRSYLHKRFLQW